MRDNTIKNAVLALLTLAGMAAFVSRAQAQLTQLHPTVYGSTEFDTRHSQFYLAGLYIGTGGLGWSPYFNTSGYLLHYRPIPTLDATQDLKSVSPTLGLAYAGRTGGVSFGGGYTWVDNENPAAPGAESGGKSGATASFGAYSVGFGRRGMRSQLLANYNFGAHYAWARARTSVPFGRSRHSARVGAEVIGQGGGLSGNTSNSWQLGPTFEYGWTPNFRTTLAGGWKTVGGTLFPDRDNAGYFKLEFSLSP
ncbi:MAG TPA: hypothetical protein VJ840_02715 [Gemmatimonadaceae bacterium]|nr:hypothetical protein [Gemmatimonadaceae bacterium]